MSKEEIATMLEAKGILPTPQRMDIAGIMLACHQHLSADQVLARVNQNGAAVSKATVYNTLGLFAEKGLLRQVIVDPTKVFYDSNVSVHHHFYNVDTGMLVDIEGGDCHVDRLPPPPPGTVPDGVDVIVRIRNQSAIA
jgi:Fur family iron response transcriptional regulator